jgi:hypothetical protein
MKKLITSVLFLLCIGITYNIQAADVHTTLNYSTTLETTLDAELIDNNSTPPRQKGSMTVREKKKSYLWFKRDQEQQMQKSYAGYMKRKKGSWFQRIIGRFIW